MKCPPNCGLCCKRVDLIQRLKPLANQDGSCRHLTSDNQCGIYDSRPNICDTAWVRVHAFPDMSADEFDELTAVFCRKLGAKI